MWNEYKGGFGKFDSDYWIGLEMLHQITNPPVQLQIFIVGPGVSDHGFTMYFENFSIASESENYRISLSSSGENVHLTFKRLLTFNLLKSHFNICLLWIMDSSIFGLFTDLKDTGKYFVKGDVDKRLSMKLRSKASFELGCLV